MRLQLAAIAIVLATPSTALAFDDQQFCAAAKQLAIAAERDIGIWIDRVTRNAGMVVACDRKAVEYTRFTYIATPSMTVHWKAAKGSQWNAAHCNNPLWREAVDNGWTIALTVAAADGGRATFKAQCK